MLHMGPVEAYWESHANGVEDRLSINAWKERAERGDLDMRLESTGLRVGLVSHATPHITRPYKLPPVVNEVLRYFHFLRLEPDREKARSARTRGRQRRQKQRLIAWFTRDTIRNGYRYSPDHRPNFDIGAFMVSSRMRYGMRCTIEVPWVLPPPI